jgi:cysteine desulfurase
LLLRESIIYADAHASSGFVWPRSAARWAELCLGPANPSSVHVEGQRAKQHLREAREGVAETLGAVPDEVVFTSGASEGLMLAVRGLCRVGGVLALGPMEHAALASEPHVALGDARAGVVAMAAVNHETGVIAEIPTVHVPLVIDAAQAALRARSLWALPQVSALAFSGHKIGAPTGSGVLLVRNGVPFVATLRGGPQEHALRAGTEAVAMAGALAEALQCAYAEREQIHARQSEATAIYEAALREIPGARIHGDGQRRAPGVTCAGIVGVSARVMVERANERGVCISSGAACAAAANEPSSVLLAMGLSRERALEAFRVSFGFAVTREEAVSVASVVSAIAAEVRA